MQFEHFLEAGHQNIARDVNLQQCRGRLLNEILQGGMADKVFLHDDLPFRIFQIISGTDYRNSACPMEILRTVGPVVDKQGYSLVLLDIGELCC